MTKDKSAWYIEAPKSMRGPLVSPSFLKTCIDGQIRFKSQRTSFQGRSDVEKQVINKKRTCVGKLKYCTPDHP